MFKLFKRNREKIRFCGRRMIIEPKYRLFYISEDGEEILTCQFPVTVVEFKMHRPYGKDIYGRNIIGLSEGDVFKITIHNFKPNSKMSILERTVAFSTRYIRYIGKGVFEELDFERIEKYKNRCFISYFKAY